jgi:hypothetical protein
VKITSAADFVEAVIQIWPPFRWDEVQEQAWTALMVCELSGFKPAVLERGFQEMVRKRKDSKIPTPAECIAACAEAKRWVDTETRDQEFPEFRQPNDAWSRERRKLAYDLIKSGIGRQAAQDDPCWITQLWDFCRNNKRVPVNQHEVDALKREAGEFDEAYLKCFRREAGPFSAELEKLGANMRLRREKLRDEALGR